MFNSNETIHVHTTYIYSNNFSKQNLIVFYTVISTIDVCRQLEMSALTAPNYTNYILHSVIHSSYPYPAPVKEKKIAVVSKAKNYLIKCNNCGLS